MTRDTWAASSNYGPIKNGGGCSHCSRGGPGRVTHDTCAVSSSYDPISVVVMSPGHISLAAFPSELN